MSIDLHIHSTCSDGTLRPEQLVRMAKARGLTAIAITDHDTVEGVAEAMAAGREYDIEVIAGLELSTVHGERPIHLLGYLFDPDSPELARALTTLQHARRQRNTLILEKLCGLGLPVSEEEVARKSPTGQTGRPHIAQVLVEKGWVRNLDDAFDRYLKKGAPAYAPRHQLEVVDAISLIAGAGGLPVLAHPATIDTSLDSLPALLEELAARGLAGVEVYYPVHSARQRKRLLTMAAAYNLVVTGGSDYHGDIRPNTSLAGGSRVRVPAEVLPRLKARLQKHAGR